MALFVIVVIVDLAKVYLNLLAFDDINGIDTSGWSEKGLALKIIIAQARILLAWPA